MKTQVPATAALACAAIALMFIQTAIAQPKRHTDEGVYWTLADRVEVYPNGLIEVVTREVGPIKPDEPSPAMPRRVETWTVMPDGTRERGYPMRPWHDLPNFPVRVLFDAHGYWLEFGGFLISHAPPPMPCDSGIGRRDRTGWVAGATLTPYPLEVWSRLAAGHSPDSRLVCDGDADGDRDRDIGDINCVLTHWGCLYQPALPGTFRGDADGDGRVSLGDVTAVLESFGRGCP